MLLCLNSYAKSLSLALLWQGVGAFLLIAMLTACGSSRNHRAIGDADPATPQPLTNLALGCEYLAYSSSSTGCFSPLSLSYALALARCGARGETLLQLQRFALPEQHEALVSTPCVDLANALWLDKPYRPTPAYSTCVQQFAPVKVANLPLAANPSASADSINSWIKAFTRGKITSLVKPSALHGAELVLTNAIHFHAPWLYPFAKKDTQVTDFHATRGDVAVPMMRMVSDSILYAQSDLGRLIALPYANRDFEMIFFLPPVGSEANLKYRPPTEETLRSLYTQGRKQRVQVHIPRFRASLTLELVSFLRSLGLQAPFSPAADFARLIDASGIRIGQVVQSAEVLVNEESTQASAATAIIMVRGAIQQQYFVADRPFFFLISRAGLASPLFVGRYDG